MSHILSLSDRVSHELYGALQTVGAPSDASPLVRPSDFADFQANGIMPLAKKMGKNPRDLAADVICAIDCQSSPTIAQLEVTGPGFINITVKDQVLLEQIFTRHNDDRLGIPWSEHLETIVIDYAQPNVAKEMHVGHLRSSVLGDCLNRILTYAGHTVIPRHHIGDWGTSFGMLIQYLIETQSDITSEEGEFAGLEPIEKLNILYKTSRVQFDADPIFQEAARKRVVALQAGDKQTLEHWQRIVKVSLQYFHQVFDRLQIPISDENIKGESYYNSSLAETVEILLHKAVAEKSQGAVCVFFAEYKGKDGQLTPLIVQKSDGGFGYAATDLAAIRDRIEILKADRILYVVDVRQGLHFSMVFKAAQRAGFVRNDQTLVHIPCGMVLGSDGKPFKTRAGESAKLIDLIDAATQKAQEVMQEKSGSTLSPELLEHKAEDIGIGAVKYADLSTSLGKDYIFDVDAMIAFQGKTSVYIQYAYARIQSIFRQEDCRREMINISHVDLGTYALAEPEKKLALLLDNCAEVYRGVCTDYEPHRLAHYLYMVAVAFTSFYDACPIRKADTYDRKVIRLLLADMTSKVISWGLTLLGIATIDQL